MLKKNMEVVIRIQDVEIRLLKRELKMKNDMLFNLRKELEDLKRCKEECLIKIKEIKKEINRQNYSSSRNLENRISTILDDIKNTSLNS